ncbi:MAG: tetratricopeptide repeat protein [Sumerlaeia bacterium]
MSQSSIVRPKSYVVLFSAGFLPLLLLLACANTLPKAKHAKNEPSATPAADAPAPGDTQDAPAMLAKAESRDAAKPAPPTSPDDTSTTASDTKPETADWRAMTASELEEEAPKALLQLLEAKTQGPEPTTQTLTSDALLEDNFLFLPGSAEQIVPETVIEGGDAADIDTRYTDAGTAASEYVKAALLSHTGYQSRALKHYLDAVERDPENLWLKVRAARAALSQQDLPRAQRMAEEILATHPDSWEAKLILGQVFTFRERFDRAREWYEQVLDSKPGNVEALEAMARIAYSFNELENTIELTDRILAEDRRNLQALLWSAEATALTGDMTKSLDRYSQLIRYRSSLIGRLVEMGRRLEGMNRTDDALKLYEKGLVLEPRAEALRLRWEDILTKRGGTGAVYEAYRDIVAANPLDMRVQDLYADFLLRQNDLEGLIAHRKHMLEVDPEHLESLLSMARIELQQGNLDAARLYFDRVIESGPEDPGIYRDIGLIFMNQGDMERAEQLLKKALILSPQDPDTTLALAALAERMEDDFEAERLLKRALDFSPANERILALLGDFYRRRDRTREASGVLEQLLAVNPGNTAANLSLAQMYLELEEPESLDRLEKNAGRLVEDKLLFFKSYGDLTSEFGEWRRARWGYEKALELVPANIQIRNLLAQVYLHLNEKEIAQETLLQVRDDVTDQTRVFYNLALANLYKESGEPELALPPMRTLVEMQPENLGFREDLIATLIDAGMDAEVTEELNQAVRDFGPEDPEGVKMLRASVYTAQGDYRRALGVLRPLLSENPDDPDLLFQVAMLNGEMDNLQEAEKLYDRLIALLEKDDATKPFQATVKNNLSYLYANRSENLNRAEKLALEALEINPRAGFILDTVGWIYFKQGEFEEAEKYLKKAEKMSLPDPEIYEHLGELYAVTERPALAREYFDRAIDAHADRDPDKATALRDRMEELELGLQEASAN